MAIHATNPVGIIGSGTMGAGIAQAAAAAGWKVHLFDIEETLLEQATSNISKRFERLVEKGRISDEQSIEFLWESLKIALFFSWFVSAHLVHFVYIGL